MPLPTSFKKLAVKVAGGGGLLAGIIWLGNLFGAVHEIHDGTRWALNAAEDFSVSWIPLGESKKAKLEIAIKGCALCPKVVNVPRDSNIMGTGNEWSPLGINQTDAGHESPPHEVRLRKTIQFTKHPILRSEYAEFVTASEKAAYGCRSFNGEDWQVLDQTKSWKSPAKDFVQKDDEPVVCVSWDDAVEYATWLSDKTGKHFRLPTEAEWEYAIRGNTRGLRPWKSVSGELNDSRLCRYANLADKTWVEHFKIQASPLCSDQHVFTSSVSSGRLNEYGIQNPLGNVWNWVEDCWTENYDQRNYDGPTNDTSTVSREAEGCERVLRGASYADGAERLRSAHRYHSPASFRNANYGFRLVREISIGEEG